MKKFLVLGNLNFPKIVDELLLTGEMWCGTKYNGSNMMSFNYQGNEANITSIFWTNLNYGFEKTFVELTNTYNTDEYKKYDNYDAIEVSKSKNIPMDYTGLMGVPMSFIYKINYNQFELVDILGSSKFLFLNGKKLYKRLIIRNKHPVPTENTVNNCVDG